WLADSGATSHVCRNRELFATYSAQQGTITGLGGHTITSFGRGTVKLDFKIDNKVQTVTFTDVVHAPNAINNLLSLSRLT
ncbi:hypothetical protein C8J57DRAFT_975774, partial [Mycena rebaudengoi]